MEHLTIFKNTAFQTLARGSTTFVGFIITILIARFFGSQGYGEYTKIVSIVTIFYLIIDFGFNAAYIRDKKYNYGHLLYSRLGIAFILFLLLNLAVSFLPFDPTTNTGFSEVVKIGVLVFSLSFFNQAIIFTTSGIFQKKQNYRYFMFSQAAGAILNLILVVIFVKLSFSIIFIISSFVLSGLFSASLSLVLAKEKPTFSIKLPKELFLVSLPLAAMLIFNLVYFKIDAIILAFFKPSVDVGIYGLSFRIFEFLIAIPLFLSNSIYPILASKTENIKNFLEFFQKYKLIFLTISFIVLALGWILSPLLALINEDFSRSVLPLRILIVSLPLFFVTSLYQWALITLKQQKFLMVIYFANAILNIVLNLIFIPKYSYLASAVITGVCEVFVAGVLIWQFSRILSERQEKR